MQRRDVNVQGTYIISTLITRKKVSVIWQVLERRIQLQKYDKKRIELKKESRFAAQDTVVKREEGKEDRKSIIAGKEGGNTFQSDKQAEKSQVELDRISPSAA